MIERVSWDYLGKIMVVYGKGAEYKMRENRGKGSGLGKSLEGKENEVWFI